MSLSMSKQSELNETMGVCTKYLLGKDDDKCLHCDRMKFVLDWHNKRELEARIDTLEYAKISPKFKIEEKIEQTKTGAEEI